MDAPKAPPREPRVAPRQASAARRLLRALAWPFCVCFSGRAAALALMGGGLALCWLVELAAFALLGARWEGWPREAGGILFAVGFFGGFAVTALFGLLALIGACWRDKPWLLFFALVLTPVDFVVHFFFSYIGLISVVGC